MKPESLDLSPGELAGLFSDIDSQYRNGFRQNKAMSFGQREHWVQPTFDNIFELQKKELEKTILTGFPQQFLWGNVAKCALEFREYFRIYKNTVKRSGDRSVIDRITLTGLARRGRQMRITAEDAIERYELTPQDIDYERTKNRIRYLRRLETVAREAGRLGKSNLDV